MDALATTTMITSNLVTAVGRSGLTVRGGKLDATGDVGGLSEFNIREGSTHLLDRPGFALEIVIRSRRHSGPKEIGLRFLKEMGDYFEGSWGGGMETGRRRNI